MGVVFDSTGANGGIILSQVHLLDLLTALPSPCYIQDTMADGPGGGNWNIYRLWSAVGKASTFRCVYLL